MLGGRWHALRRLTWRQRALMAEASLWLLLARLALAVVPFRWIAARLGRKRGESAAALAPEDVARATQIGRAVEAMSRHAPWQSRCLAQAIAARLMLKQRGIPHTLYVGVAKDGGHALAAHAWLRCGPAIVTGRPGHQRFTVVSTFAD